VRAGLCVSNLACTRQAEGSAFDPRAATSSARVMPYLPASDRPRAAQPAGRRPASIMRQQGYAGAPCGLRPSVRAPKTRAASSPGPEQHQDCAKTRAAGEVLSSMPAELKPAKAPNSDGRSERRRAGPPPLAGSASGSSPHGLGLLRPLLVGAHRCLTLGEQSFENAGQNRQPYAGPSWPVFQKGSPSRPCVAVATRSW